MRGWTSLLVVLALAQAGALHAAPAPCPGLPPGVSMEPVDVHIGVADRTQPAAARITGVLQAPGVPDEPLRRIARSSLCEAAVGNLAVDGRSLCGAFGPGFAGDDKIHR